jgi:pimeloyl-ACP methyl ester carboxylesterase
VTATARIWLEQRWPLERAALVADPVWWGKGVPRGNGERVLLIPGLFAGDWSLLTLGRWLERIGYRPISAGIQMNSDCAGATVDRLAKRLREQVPPGGRIALVGQSRGGLLARALAIRERERVAGLITLGSPMCDEWALNPLVGTAIQRVARSRIPHTFTRACAEGECCRRYLEERSARVPAGIGFVSLYTRSDGIVDWRSCLDPQAEAVEVEGSHAGMGASAPAYRTIGRALPGFFDQK